MQIQDIDNLLIQAGANQKHRDAFWRNWIQLRKGASKRQPIYPKKVQKIIPQLLESLDSICSVCEESWSAEEGAKLALTLSDGQIIEMVLLPSESVCISTQVGCAVGCVFCATGKTGLVRQLSDLEIISQVRLARKFQKIRKVVFMGMGEPSHNLWPVMRAVNFLATYSGIGWKELVVSSIGDKRLFEALSASPIKPALAISLHSVFDDKRQSLIPYAKMKVAGLLEESANYAQAGKYPIQFQWTLIRDINDGDDEIEELIRLWGRRFAILNMIPVNEVPGSAYRRPSKERLSEIQKRLKEGGVLLKFRDSTAQDVNGG